MKQFFTVMICLMAFTMAQAEEKKVWEGSEAISWNTEVAPGSQFETPDGTFTGLKKDDVIKIYTTTTYDSPQYVVTYKAGEKWDWTDLTTTITDGVISYTVESSEIATEIAERGLVLRGQAWTATKITITTEEPEVTYETVVVKDDINTETGEWKKNVELTYDNRGKLSEAMINDIVRITFNATGESSHIAVVNVASDKWSEKFLDKDVETGDNQTVEFTISDATTVEAIQLNGIAIGGNTITVQKVELLKASNRYDAVPVTIGDDGIATFSSSKHLSFAQSGITPYYASAASAGSVTLTSIDNKTTWGHQGYVIRGNAGHYDIPVIAEGAFYPTGNYLQATSDYARDLPLDANSSKYHYIFAKNGDNLGFYHLEGTYKLAAHRAYLLTDTDIRPSGGSGNARIAMIFSDDTTTGIHMTAIPSANNDVLYNLSGQQVAQPTKGLYIRNGKKIIIK